MNGKVVETMFVGIISIDKPNETKKPSASLYVSRKHVTALVKAGVGKSNPIF